MKWGAATAGGVHGMGYTYGHAASAMITDTVLADVVRGRDVMDIAASTKTCDGRCAISAAKASG